MLAWIGCRRAPLLLAAALAVSSAACREEGTIVVKSLKFEGIKSVDVALLKSVLATREAARIPLLGVRPPWSKPKQFFDRGRFDEDLQRIRAFYSDRGYPDARVASFDVKLNQQQDAVDVTLTIVEGDPIRVVGVTLVGFERLPPDHLSSLRGRIPVRIGQPRDRQTVVSGHEMALNELRDHGFPYAQVATEEAEGDNRYEIAITYTAVPGTEARFGAVEIVGNKSVSNTVIWRQLTMTEGELYRRSVVQESQRRLFGLSLFQFVNVEPVRQEGEPAVVPMRVTVAEGPHQRVKGGVGYGTEERARVDGEYRHVNFLGGARTFGAHARFSSRDRGLRLDFTQPYVWTSTLAFRAEGQQWYGYTPAYNSIVRGGRMSLKFQRSAGLSLTTSFISERTISTIAEAVLGDPRLRNDLIAIGLDPETGTQRGTLSALGLNVQFTRTDNVLNPRRGYQFGVQAEQAGRLILPGSFKYFALTGDSRAYLPIGRRIVVANRAQFGDIRPVAADPTLVPFAKKYFLGGASSLRGWGRYEVSPIETSGLPIGGNAMVAASSELRAALRGKLGGVLFVDAGNVWKDKVDLASLRASIGAGIRYQTPVGPLRFDFGYQLTPIEGLLINGAPQARRWRVHFSIGQAF